MINIIKYKKWYILFSLLLLVPGTISLIVFKLNLAIDFTGGSVFTFDMKQNITPKLIDGVSSIVLSKEIRIDNVITDTSKTLEIRTQAIDAKKNLEVKDAISKKYVEAVETSFETIGPSVGKETTKKSFLAISVASLGILFYIAYAFRDVPKPYSSFKFGASAIIAMIHDALVVLGIFSILGHFFKLQIDALFITAILTVIGFSVHDTIVVFDRIRENLKKLPTGMKFEEIVNYSIVETLNRSFATSLTVIITLTSLYVLGGVSIKHFVLALLIGITSGTYSSIFTASPILVFWENYQSKKRK